MVFYNNRLSIADINEKEIYLVRNIENKLILNYYSYSGDIEESILANDFLDEFDILIKDDGSIYLIYQDKQHNLNLTVIKGDNRTSHKLTTGKFPKIYELNIILHNHNLNMIFLYPVKNTQDVFQIEHNLLKDDKWHSYLVDQIKISKVLNPIKLINKDDSMFLAYYYDNQICLKSFSEMDGEWKESIVLTDNKEKLYLDIIYDSGYFHLVYSEVIDGNYIIKYKMFKYDVSLYKVHEADISYKSNPTNPTIIKNNDILWIIWNESSRIYSRYSNDNGITWSEIKSWEESIKYNVVRYKYTTNINLGSRILDNTFGSIYPDIKFIGFN